jgi:hypothetical protein
MAITTIMLEESELQDLIAEATKLGAEIDRYLGHE